MSIRKAIIQQIELLSNPSDQVQYEKDVPIPNVPAELICVFCDDLYHPKSDALQSQFTQEELEGLERLFRVLDEAAKIEVSGVRELILTREWQNVISVSRELNSYYAKHA